MSEKSVELFSLPYLSKPQNHGMIFIDCTAAHLKFQTSHQTKAKLLFFFLFVYLDLIVRKRALERV